MVCSLRFWKMGLEVIFTILRMCPTERTFSGQALSGFTVVLLGLSSLGSRARRDVGEKYVESLVQQDRLALLMSVMANLVI